MGVSVVFRVLEEDKAGNPMGRPFVWDLDDRSSPATTAGQQTLPWMTLVEAEGYARTMRYDLVVIAEAQAARG